MSVEIDERSLAMYSRIAALLDEPEDNSPNDNINNISDIGAILEFRFGAWNRPRVIIYEGEEVAEQTRNGLGIRFERHPDLSGLALVVEKVEDKDDTYFIMLMNAANSSATSRMDRDDPNRDFLLERYGVVPSVHDEDPRRGILFQGELSYSSSDTRTTNSSMTFNYQPLFFPLSLEDKYKYEMQQRELAHRYFTLPQQDLGESTLIEGILNPAHSRVKNW